MTFKEEVLMKLMVQEELTRGTPMHCGIEKAIEIVENTPDTERRQDDKH